MEVKREYYLNQLISHKHNGLIKIISGIRRCGKSYLLSELFRKHLLAEGVKEDHIIHIALDDYEKKQYRNPDNCYQYVKSSIKDDEMYYLLLDEVQMMDISTPSKYYFTDIGLRNARLNFRQQEETHIMENIIYNELNIRGYEVDVGEIGILEKNRTGYTEKKIEVDFVASKGSKKYYIQSVLIMPTEEKKAQEERPLLKIADSFKKIIIVKDNIKPYHDDNGIGFIGLKDFLLDMNSLDF